VWQTLLQSYNTHTLPKLMLLLLVPLIALVVIYNLLYIFIASLQQKNCTFRIMYHVIKVGINYTS
jgi:hypothetical protein